MATKKQVPGPSGSARIRFVMLEADVDNGNLSEFANTIANALKGSSYQKALTPASNAHPKEHSNGESIEASVDESQDEVIDDDASPPPAKPSTKPRKPFVSKVKVIELDLNSGDMPFEKYVAERAPEQLISKFLVIAVWLKEFRQVDEITADHAYTCFKKVGWGVVSDMTQPFRDLKKGGRGDYENGKFKVNHIGVDVVIKMNRSS
jgi:hypothetical protein